MAFFTELCPHPCSTIPRKCVGEKLPTVQLRNWSKSCVTPQSSAWSQVCFTQGLLKSFSPDLSFFSLAAGLAQLFGRQLLHHHGYSPVYQDRHQFPHTSVQQAVICDGSAAATRAAEPSLLCRQKPLWAPSNEGQRGRHRKKNHPKIESDLFKHWKVIRSFKNCNSRGTQHMLLS